MKTKITIIFFSILLLFSFTACEKKDKYDMSSLDTQMYDEEDFEEFISDAKNSALNENFSSAYDSLEKARKLGVSSSELSSAKSYVALKKEAYDERIERERQARLERERQEQMASQSAGSSEGNLRDKCAILAGDFVAYSACMKNESAVFGNNLNAYYAMRGECSYLAGNDDTGLAYLCENPNKNGCIGLKASQDTINACYQCGGSNLWLRVYAAGRVLKCY